MFLPDVINTLLMGLIFIVIVVTVIRPIMLNLSVPAGGSDIDKKAIEAVNQHLLRHFQDAAAARMAEIRFQKLLLDPPNKPQAVEADPFIDWPEDEPEEVAVPEASATPDAEVEAQAQADADAAAAGAAEGVTTDETTGEAEDATPAGEVEIREGESLADIKERMRLEQEKNKKKPAIPPELLNGANSYEDKVGVVRMVVQADHSRVASLVRSMIQT